MNTPTHIAAAGLVSQVVLAAEARFAGRLKPVARRCLVGLGGLVLGLGHLVLDALPHYNWIVYLPWLTGLPGHWLIREAIFGSAVLVPIVWWGRPRGGLVFFTAVAAMYPDFEKVAHVDYGLPARLVLFRGHSLQLSSHDFGLPHPALVIFELSLVAGLLLATYGLARERRQAAGGREECATGSSGQSNDEFAAG